MEELAVRRGQSQTSIYGQDHRRGSASEWLAGAQAAADAVLNDRNQLGMARLVIEDMAPRAEAAIKAAEEHHVEARALAEQLGTVIAGGHVDGKAVFFAWQIASRLQLISEKLRQCLSAAQAFKQAAYLDLTDEADPAGTNSLYEADADKSEQEPEIYSYLDGARDFVRAYRSETEPIVTKADALVEEYLTLFGGTAALSG